jgi:hypothetical protein
MLNANANETMERSKAISTAGKWPRNLTMAFISAKKKVAITMNLTPRENIVQERKK